MLVGRVSFDGASPFEGRAEDWPPYLALGNGPSTDGFDPVIGSYSITATPYETGDADRPGPAIAIDFEIVP